MDSGVKEATYQSEARFGQRVKGVGAVDAEDLRDALAEVVKLISTVLVVVLWCYRRSLREEAAFVGTIQPESIN